MKFAFNLILLVLADCAFSQAITRKVVDSQTNSPISYATIKVLHTSKGVMASEKGEFVLNIEPADTVFVSSVGYAKKKLPGKDIGTVIYLEPAIKLLDEVTVRQTKWNRTIISGNGAGLINQNIECKLRPGETSDCFPWGEGNNTEFAEKIELPDAMLFYRIKKIYIPVSKGRCWGPLLLHVYAADTASEYPGEELLLKPVDISKAIIKKDKAVIDMSADSVYLHGSNFFFIGVGWLSPEEEEKCLTRISIIKSEKGKSYMRTLSSNSYNWFPFGIMKDLRTDTPFNVSTIYAVELDEMK